jgi:hypothetical protein
MLSKILGFVSVVSFMIYQLLALRYDCYHCLLDDDTDKDKGTHLVVKRAGITDSDTAA